MKVIKTIFWFVVGLFALIIAAIWFTDPDHRNHRGH